MDKDYQDQLQLLRQRRPVGIRNGVSLLEQTNGDVEQAVRLFEEETLRLIIHKTGADGELAGKHLVEHNFDISATLKSIEEERYSLTERILKKYKNKEEALGKIAYSVEEAENLRRPYWLDFASLKKLAPEVYCLLTVHEWLRYEGWEGLSNAVYFYLDVVTEQMEKHLDLPQLADTLLTVKAIEQQQYAQQKASLEKEGYCLPTPEFSEQHALYNTQRPLLIDNLHGFVRKYIEKFP